MSDCIEKIYCCDRDNNNDNAIAAAIMASNNNRYPYPCYQRENNDALLALLANKRDTDPMAAAAMMNGGMNNQWNNPFIYLVWMMFAQRMWGGNGCGEGFGGGCYNGQLAAMQNQMQDNHNSDLILQGIGGTTSAVRELATNLNCDFNTLNSAICDVRGGIDRLSGQVGFSAERVINAVNMGDCNVIQALKDCCCQTQRQIADFRADVQLQTCQQTGELRNGQRDLGVAIAQGFSQTAYETQRQTCDIINAGNANTQRIIDTLNGHWKDEQALQIQDLKFQNSQLKQNQYLASLVSGNGCCCNNPCATNNCF